MRHIHARTSWSGRGPHHPGDHDQDHVPCASCRGPARPHAHADDVPFCDTCLDRTRQRDLGTWDDLGTGD